MNADAPKLTVNQNGREPVAERRAVPMWLIVVLALLFYWGCLFVADKAGGFSKDVYSPYNSADEVAAANPQDPTQKLMAVGRGIFDKTCSQCHQADAKG